MSDLDRVLESLLHDLRSPLGVAGGYLRLLREQRLNGPDEAERAIVKTQDALRTMTTLCADAADWLKPEPEVTPADVAVETLVAQIAAECARQGGRLEVAGHATGRAPLTLDCERTARAVATLLGVVSRDAAATCQADVNDGVLHLTAEAPMRAGDDLAGDFDPWAYSGLSAARACRTIARAGGRCRRGPGASILVRIEFDLTTDAPAA